MYCKYALKMFLKIRNLMVNFDKKRYLNVNNLQ